MIDCVVEMFGLPPKITPLRQIEVTLEDKAHLNSLIATLRRKIPELNGGVIRAEADRLVDEYGFYINGQFYVGNEEIQLQNGDRVVLLALAPGG